MTLEVDAFPDGVELNETLAVLGQTRAMRRLRDEPVPEPLIDALVWAATRAASPNNTQLWSFVVVTDPDVRAEIGTALEIFLRWIDSLGTPADDRDAHIRHEARHLVEHVADAPVLIFVCVEHSYPTRRPDPRYLWSTAGTASQNLIVAARSLGLGATLSMMHVGNHDAVRDILDLPEGVEIGGLIPVGWPARDFGPVRRRPIEEVVHRERW